MQNEKGFAKELESSVNTIKIDIATDMEKVKNNYSIKIFTRSLITYHCQAEDLIFRLNVTSWLDKHRNEFTTF